MEINEFIQLIKRKKQTIFAMIFLFLLFGAFFTLITPKKYTSKTKLLVVQNVSKDFDLYSVSKSNNFLSKVLSNVVESNTFYTQVLNSEFDIDKAYFTDNTDKEAKIWEKTVKASTVEDSGIINIAVIHSNQYQAGQIAKAINETLKKTHSQYHGAGEQIQIKTIDQPFTSKFPVKPNLVLNFLFSFVFGLMSALTFIYVFPEEKYDIVVIPGFNKKTRTDTDFEYGEDENYDFAEVSPNPQIYSPEQSYSREAEYGQDEPEKSTPEVFRNEDDLAYEEVVKRGRIENVMKI